MSAEGRAGSFVPEARDEDRAWVVLVPDPMEGSPALAPKVQESVLTIGDSCFGTRGVLEEADGAGSVLANGVYDESAEDVPVLLEGPGWTGLRLEATEDGQADHRLLDLRTGLLHRRRDADGLRTVRFSSLARPGTMVLRAEGQPGRLAAGPPLAAPVEDTGVAEGYPWASASAPHGGIVAAAAQRDEATAGRQVVERLAAYVADPLRTPPVEAAVDLLRTAEKVGFDDLLAEQRAAWAEVWEDCRVDVGGDPETELGVRYSVFQLVASTPTSGEAAVGARGLSGPGYAGHVFWDADVFVLPTLAAIRPEAARAMLEYRVNRLDAARRIAAEQGRAGARFPWESARDGFESTPKTMVDSKGNLVAIETAEQEEHIIADVAWAAWQYVCWTGDHEFRDGPGRPLITEGARYWASRVERDDAGRGHISRVIGPDEYHEGVDDNVYTNVMVRWHLNLAATLVEQDGIGGTADEAATWREIASSLVDNYDPETGRYEQFTGFYELEPYVVSEVLPAGAAADTILGREVTLVSQIVKQTDVLGLHFMVPDEVAEGSLQPNLDYYAPRTSHGSSLSPAVHAGLFAMAGRPQDGLELLRLATHLDLHNLNNTTAKGLHIATMGGLWQALAVGFGGLRVAPDGTLSVDPHLPPGWSHLALRVQVHGTRVQLTLRADAVEASTDGPMSLRLPDGSTHQVDAGTRRFVRTGREAWSAS